MNRQERERKTSVVRNMAVPLLPNFKANKNRSRRASAEYKVFNRYMSEERMKESARCGKRGCSASRDLGNRLVEQGCR